MKKNVLLVRNVAGDGFGGGEVYQLKLARQLRKHGFCPVIVTNSRQLLQNAKKEGFETLRSLYLEQQNWSGWRNLFLPVYWAFQLKLKNWYENTYKEYNPVVVNIQSKDDWIAGTLAAKKIGIRILWTDHADFRNWVLWNVNKRFKNVIGKRIVDLSGEVEKVIFVSERIKDETVRMIKPKRMKNVIVIKNGVEDTLGDYREVKRKKHSFIFVGRVVEEKGIRELLESFQGVVKKFPDTTLDVYGDGNISKYEKMCGKSGRVRFRGRADKPLKALAENEIFVLPSYREGLSLSLLDAAMMGKKIIASDVDGNPEVVKDGETGLLVPAKNVKKLTEAMLYMLENKEEAEQMAKNARKYYRENFDFEKIFKEKMLPLYNIKKEE